MSKEYDYKSGEQKALRAFYNLFGRLGLTMINEYTIEDALGAGKAEIARLQNIEREYRKKLGCKRCGAVSPEPHSHP